MKLGHMYVVDLEFTVDNPATTVISTDGLEQLIKAAIEAEFARLREKHPVNSPLILPVRVASVQYETEYEVPNED